MAHCLLESRQLFPGQPIQLQDQVSLPDETRVSLQAQWIDLGPQQASCIVVILENLTAVAHQQAQIDAWRYGLTEREAQVWERALLGLSYRDIGQELFIALNTVKRHMKSIRRKQSDGCG
ncbi:hypothetical protein XM38_020160 [Halomicronema hongdechloris C2206]|uniref:HTH luxR-type domain-containing protein n=1 Tax=Halomicronema hongdechloris C2206 TaxID=1641165 RepID=A0A1Z3HLB3_9CYAN|nr:helix-turn-helix transcriptional regulator [Halomicronema hongdechloris]ASC71066.1 hypothetical protein XM38_020160 [Halomicronema hongdechloris C2206]